MESSELWDFLLGLADGLEEARRVEGEQEVALLKEQERLENCRARALRLHNGGKNSEVRAIEHALALEQDEDYQGALDQVHHKQYVVAVARARVKGLEAKIGLAKTYLWSQARVET